MALPLFMLIRVAKKRKGKEFGGSGILALQHLKERNQTPWLFYWEAPSNTDAIDAMEERLTRDKGPMPPQSMAPLMSKFITRLYGNSNAFGHLARALSRYESGCHVSPENKFQRLIGAEDFWPRSTALVAHSTRATYTEIRIDVAKHVPCFWCGSPVFYEDQWRQKSRRVMDGYASWIRCNGPDCRRLDWLAHTPQTRGGIRPKKADGNFQFGTPSWRNAALAAYLQLKSKELRNGKRN